MATSPCQALGLLHPGAMGATVGGAAALNVKRVLWASDGRSQATRARAESVGLDDAGSLEMLIRESDVLVSVCPPAAAVGLARRVAAASFAGIYVDANAISPESVRQIAAIFAGGPGAVVDGGIIGPPALRAGTTRLHLSGERADEVADCFREGALEARVINGPVGAASALKMSFAAYTKGTSALLAAIYALARAEGVDEELLREWESLVPELPGRLRAGVPAAAGKAWRFVGEMEEIAATFKSAGLPDGFHRAAAEIYRRLEPFRELKQPPTPEAIADRLNE